MRRAADEDEIVQARGWPRVGRPIPLRRVLNLASDVGWLHWGARAFTRSNRVDVWFSPANVLPFHLARPMVASILDTNVLDVAGSYDRAYTAYANRMFASAARRASIVLTISEASRVNISDRFGIAPDKIVVAYPGIDHAISTRSAAHPLALPGRFALFVGQTEPHKNLPRLVAAWAQDIPNDLHLVLAGPAGRDEEPIRQAIGDSRARERIHRVGRVSDDVLATLYEDATCFVFPSIAEGFGMPPLEAMARGVPTAVSSVPALVEVTRGGALVFDPYDVESIASAVRTLASDSDERERLRKAGPEVAKAYRWSDTAATVWNTIRALLE